MNIITTPIKLKRDAGKLKSNPDKIPNSFSFTAQTGVDLDTDIISNTVTVAGINAASPISITGGLYQIDSNSFTSASGLITNGQTVKIKLHSSASNSTASSATLTIGGISATFTVTTLSSAGAGTVFARANFSDGNVIPAPITPDAVWDKTVLGGSTLTVVDGMLRGYSPLAESDNDIVFAIRADIVTDNVWIKFKAKFEGTPHAIKFCKVHGKTTNGYANCTFGIDGGGEISRFSFGDGTNTANDTGYILFYDGSYPELTGRNYGLATIETPQMSSFAGSLWNNEVHEFWCCVKFNSGTSAENEVNDGYMAFYIDGQLYGKITNMFNRHWSNDGIEYISFYDIAQGSDYGYTLYYDDIVLSVDGFEE